MPSEKIHGDGMAKFAALVVVIGAVRISLDSIAEVNNCLTIICLAYA